MARRVVTHIAHEEMRVQYTNAVEMCRDLTEMIEAGWSARVLHDIEESPRDPYEVYYQRHRDTKP